MQTIDPFRELEEKAQEMKCAYATLKELEEMKRNSTVLNRDADGNMVGVHHGQQVKISYEDFFLTYMGT